VLDNASTNLALNLRQLRSARQLSQTQLAVLAGIPRPTLANLESGSANPTLSVLMRLASALQVLIEELIAPPHALARFFAADDLPSRQQGPVLIRKIMPEPAAGLDIERMELPPGSQEVSLPHARGSVEHLTCERGTIILTIGTEQWTLECGDVIVFRGDQLHGYHNTGQELAVAYRVITLAPIAG